MYQHYDSTFDRFIGYSITLDKMDIRSFKGLLKEHNVGGFDVAGSIFGRRGNRLELRAIEMMALP